ncbi:FG-GAP repeat protein [Candidatus Peregrinibacteria bacterium]|nr:FG-GAP repeat protein [Candidatus Peregrinibacteria bacterium]
MVHELDTALSVDKIEFAGTYPGGQFGAEIVSGDFNNDGLDDLIVSSPFATYDNRQWSGMVQLIFGRNSIVEGSSDYHDISFFGESGGDQLGTSLATGDFNRDGFEDFAIGAFKASFEGNHTGKVYIMNGRPPEAFKNIQTDFDFSLNRADIILKGFRDGDGFGYSLATGDIDSDSTDDLLVSSPFSDSINYPKSGNVSAYYGSIRGISEDQNVLFRGNKPGERFGASIGVADIDGDTKNDVLMGAYSSTIGKNEQAGRMYMYSGKKLFPRIVDIASITLEGDKNRQWFGFDLDTGDINGDGIDDMAISSFPYTGDRKDAMIKIYFGGERFLSKKNSPFVPDAIINDANDEAIPGASVILSDINGDKKDEVIVGAPGINTLVSDAPGDVYIVYGDVIGYDKIFSISKKDVHSLIHGENADDWFGYSAAVMDFNHDGVQDIVVGSRYSEGKFAVNNGKVFIFPGNNEIFGHERPVLDSQGSVLARGEILTVILDQFDLKKKKVDVLDQCKDYIDFCLFNFMAMSSYDGINLEGPLVLYPDVQPENPYYEAVNTATLLGIVNGYMSEYGSPFKPDDQVTRIQALKIIFGANDLVFPRYRFELIRDLGSEENLTSQKSYFVDVNSKISHMWWYPRYINFGVENGIVDDDEFFRPEDPITEQELQDLINRTLTFINARDEETES